MHFNSPILKYTHPILKYIIEKYKYEKQDIIYINQNTNNNGYDIDNNIKALATSFYIKLHNEFPPGVEILDKGIELYEKENETRDSSCLVQL